jgi:hypothetical protein
MITTNKLYESISTKLYRTLAIDMGDHQILIQKVGVFDRESVYTWTVVEPTECEMTSSCDVLGFKKLMERLDLIIDTGNLRSEESFSIDLFFGKTQIK